MAPSRLRPQIEPTEEAAGVACPRQRLQIDASEEGAGVTRRTGISSMEPATSMPDDDDMLREILLRLPPQLSSLPRASAPPLLGVFERNHEGILFTPILDPPDCIPPHRFPFGRHSGSWGYNVLHCRHGLLLLLKNGSGTEVVVCDPITNEQLRVAIPPELRTDFLGGAVLCAASDLGHVHVGGSPFKVVLVSTGKRDTGHLTSVYCVYSSETGVWGDLILTGDPCWILEKSAVLLGDRLYWLSLTDISIVEFDLDEHSITTIKCPPVTFDITYGNSQIIQAEDGAVGFAALSYPRFQMWRRSANGHGVPTWVHWKTIAMCTILGLPSPVDRMFGWLLGYDEVTDVVFLSVDHRVYMVQLKSMQSRKLHEIRYTADRYFPFTSFYVPGIAIAGGL
ncbi:unnamed protein product [Alopecurus aequalis]